MVILTDPQNDLGSTVMTSAHHRGMVLVIKSRAPKINEVDLRTEEYPSELRGTRRQRAR